MNSETAELLATAKRVLPLGAHVRCACNTVQPFWGGVRRVVTGYCFSLTGDVCVLLAAVDMLGDYNLDDTHVCVPVAVASCWYEYPL